MSCIYILKFKNKNNDIVGLYIGKSKNLKSRLKKHNTILTNPKNEVSKARANYKFDYEILSENILDEELIKEAEYIAIKIMKDLQINNYNRYLGTKLDDIRINQISQSQTGKGNSFYGKNHSKKHIEKLKLNNLGRNNPNAKNIEFYKNNGRTRSAFKTSCKRLGYDFNNFIETFYGWYTKPNGKRERLYTYTEKGMEFIGQVLESL